jgi:hypothetical protein
MNGNGYRTEHLPDSGRRIDPLRTGDFAAPAEAAHLTEDQINEQLIGDLGRPWSDHLAACDLCVARVADARTPLAHFKAVTLAWAERRSATLPLHQEIARSARFHPRLAWAAAVSVALAIGFAVPVVSHHERKDSAQLAAHTSTISNQATDAGAADSGSTELADGNVCAQAQIVRDNQMLQAIDRELDSSVEAPETLGLQPLNSAAPKRAQSESLPD